tara:strand:+ start:432 stop:1175 length:744 start_codon:yes stop_codon:yes gene_type:complete
MQIEVEGATLNYEISGDSSNPALVLWHGAGCTLRMWDTALKNLKDRFFCIAFDVRGAGESIVGTGPSDQFTFEQYSKDINAILEELEIQKLHLWSMAWGTRAAIAYCSLNPEKVLSAVFSDASVGVADIAAQKEGVKKSLSIQDESGMTRFDLPLGWNKHRDPETAQLSLSAASKFNLSEAIEDLKMPIMLMTGDYDPNLKSSKEMLQRLPSARLKILEGVGHGSVLQRPDLTVTNFVEFHASLGLS